MFEFDGNRGWKKILALVLCALLFAGSPALSAQAAGSLTYGSGEYTPPVNGEFPIGVYVSADEAIGSYRAVLVYDAGKLEYVSGGTLLEPGRVEITGGGEQNSYRTMLAFQTLVMGSSQISVESLELYSDAEGTQPIDILEQASVAVRVPVAEQNRLTALAVDGAPVEGFAPEGERFSATVPYDVTEPSITAAAADPQARISISDTALEVGENTVWVDVTYQGQTMRYELDITRQSQAQTASSSRVLSSEEAVASHHRWQEMSPLQKALLIVGIVVAVGLAALLIMLIQETLRRRRRRLRREQWERTHHLGQKKQEPEIGNEDGLPEEAGQVSEIAEAAEEAGQGRKTAGQEPEREAGGREAGKKPVISIQNVCMYFKITQDGADSLKEFLIRTLTGRNHYRELKALDHVSFDVYEGEVVGIIGTNGSGKSTLLKLVSGVLSPTSGKIEVDQSKVQLLTLGTGFDMELTAKENVYLNGSLIGYTREYIDEKYDDIVAFAELEGFMDERVKNFSSGMVSRLGFAIATMRDTPEILILDEVLSVGDMFFREKSLKRVKEMMHGGSTVLIVSHSPGVIRQNCTRAVWIEKGILKADGNPKTVCALYEQAGQQAAKQAAGAQPGQQQKAAQPAGQQTEKQAAEKPAAKK